jgi:MATE family multidrug resistance protein
MSRRHRFLAESRAQLRLAGPIILSQVAQVLAGLVDTVMSGRAGAREQAVVALGVALWIPAFVCLMNVVQALSPLVAHHFGAGDREAVVRDTQDGIWLAAWSGALPLLLVPFAPAALEAARVEPALAQRTGVFLWGIGLGLPAAMVLRAFAFYSASLNRTRPMMVVSFVGLGTNAALNDVLIHGRFGLPALGGAGCGWATGIGMWLSLAGFAVWTARSRAYAAWYLWRGWTRPRWEAQKRLLRLGLPMGAAGLAEVAAFSSVAVLAGRFGDVQIAAHQVALNFAALVFMLPMGLSAAIAVRIGHALGAGDPREARRIAWTGMALAGLFALAAIGPIAALRNAVAAVYSEDPAVRALAARLLLFAAAWIVFDAAQVCAIGALRGYRVTLAPMALMLVAFWGVGVPLGTWLGWHGVAGSGPLKVPGFWIGLVAGLVTVSIGLVAALRRAADAAVRDVRDPGSA